MKQLLIAAATALAVAGTGLGASLAIAAEGSGSCGKGKVYNPDLKKCVKKPKGSGSGSYSG